MGHHSSIEAEYPRLAGANVNFQCSPIFSYILLYFPSRIYRFRLAAVTGVSYLIRCYAPVIVTAPTPTGCYCCQPVVIDAAKSRRNGIAEKIMLEIRDCAARRIFFAALLTSVSRVTIRGETNIREEVRPRGGRRVQAVEICIDCKGNAAMHRPLLRNDN